MMEDNKRVLRQSVFLWIGTAFVIAFNTAAALSHSPSLIYSALALTGMMALVGIGFGVWAGCVVAGERRRFQPPSPPSRSAFPTPSCTGDRR